MYFSRDSSAEVPLNSVGTGLSNVKYYLEPHSNYDASNINTITELYGVGTLPSWKDKYSEMWSFPVYIHDQTSYLPQIKGICNDVNDNYFDAYKHPRWTDDATHWVSVTPGRLVLHDTLYETKNISALDIDSTNDWFGYKNIQDGTKYFLICAYTNVNDSTIKIGFLDPGKRMVGDSTDFSMFIPYSDRSGNYYNDAVILKIMKATVSDASPVKNMSDVEFLDSTIITLDVSWGGYNGFFNREKIIQGIDDVNRTAWPLVDYVPPPNLSYSIIINTYDGSWLDSSTFNYWIDTTELKENYEDGGWDGSVLFPVPDSSDVELSNTYIPDDVLRGYVEDAANYVMGRPIDSTVYMHDLLQIRELYIPMYEDYTSIGSLSGIAFVRNLENLVLNDNTAITDVSSLADGWI